MAKQRGKKTTAGGRTNDAAFGGGASQASDGAAKPGQAHAAAGWPVDRWLWVQCPVLVTVASGSGPFVRTSQIAGRRADEALSRDPAPGPATHRGRRERQSR